MKLTVDQERQIRQEHGRKSVKQLAKELGVSRRQVEAAVAAVDDSPWEGRESRLMLLAGAVLVLVLGVAGYATNLSHSEFHFDDVHAVEQNAAIKTLYNKAIKDSRTDLNRGQRLGRFVRKHGDTAAAIYDYNLYRMVTYWTFAYSYYDHPFDEAEDVEAFEAAVGGFHADNNRIHYLNGLLALWLAFVTFTAPAFRRARDGPRWPIAAAVIAAVIFVAHPLQTQAVTYLSQRAESLAGTFYLLGLALYATARLRSLNAEVRGSAPWMTGLVLGGAGLVLVLGALASTTSVLGLTGFVRLLGLVVVGSIAGVVFLIKSGRDEWGHAVCTVGAFVAFALGLESKEIVATLPVAICAWELLFVPAVALPAAEAEPAAEGVSASPAWVVRDLLTGFVERLRYLGPWAAIVGGVFLLAIAFGGVNIIGQVLAEGVEEGGQATGAEVGNAAYLFTEFNVFWTYLRLFLLPYGQTLDWDYPLVQFGLGDGATWVSLLGGAMLVGCLGLVAWRGGRARIPSFALLLAVLVLAPTSTLIVLPDVIYEHRWYIPLFGGALVVAALVERGVRSFVPEAQQLVALLAVALVLGVGLTALTRGRNQVWVSEITLWKDAAEKSAGKPRPWTNLGLAYQNTPSHYVTFKARDEQGQPVERRIGGKPVKLPDGTTLVMITSDMGQQPLAIPPGLVLSIEAGEGGNDKALASYAKALEIDPDYVKALNNISLIRINQADSARFEAQALAQLGMLYQQQGNADGVAAVQQRQTEALERMRAHGDEAVAILDRLVRLEPNNAIYWVNRGNTYATLLDDLDTAYDSVRRSYELPEGPAEGRVTCGTIKIIQGNDAYRAAEAAGDDPIAAARPHWEVAREHFRDYLLNPGEGQFRSRARSDLNKVEEYLRGEARPAPAENQTGLPDELIPGGRQGGGHSPGDGHGH